LLRLLNEKRFRPLGEVEEKSSDFRLICATHQPLQELIKQGRFREDLYFRLRQLTLLVPPLRERRNDIPLLAESVIARHNREQRNYVSGLTPEAQAMLLANEFPGNVRQLISVIQVACERAAKTGQIDVAALDSLLDDSPGTIAIPLSGEKVNANQVEKTFVDEDLTEACERFERMMIASRLDRFKGSRSRAAASLGIPRRTLAYKCKKFSLDVDS
jgi:sigma-54-specific transcriptional regulator